MLRSVDADARCKVIDRVVEAFERRMTEPIHDGDPKQSPSSIADVAKDFSGWLLADGSFYRQRNFHRHDATSVMYSAGLKTRGDAVAVNEVMTATGALRVNSRTKNAAFSLMVDCARAVSAQQQRAIDAVLKRSLSLGRDVTLYIALTDTVQKTVKKFFGEDMILGNASTDAVFHGNDTLDKLGRLCGRCSPRN